MNAKESSGLLATQVAASRTFFLQLKGPWTERVGVALGGWEKCRPDYAVERESYPYAVFEVVVGGRGRVVLDGAAHPLMPGVCFGVDRHTRCGIYTEAGEPLEKFFFAVEGKGAVQAMEAAGLLPARVRAVPALGELREMAELITREGRRPGKVSRAICARLVEVLLLKIGEAPQRRVRARGAGRDGARENFERCRALIDAHAAEWLGLAEIAAGARIDGSSVCRLFRRFLGVSPHQYLRQRKMALAAEFLLETGGRVQDAAARVGMVDAFHFSRVFKAVHGVPPSALIGVARGGIGATAPGGRS